MAFCVSGSEYSSIVIVTLLPSLNDTFFKDEVESDLVKNKGGSCSDTFTYLCFRCPISLTIGCCFSALTDVLLGFNHSSELTPFGFEFGLVFILI